MDSIYALYSGGSRGQIPALRQAMPTEDIYVYLSHSRQLSR
jgi:hypothetical protein